MTKKQLLEKIRRESPELAKGIKLSWTKSHIEGVLEQFLRRKQERQRELEAEAQQKAFEDAMTAFFGTTFGPPKNYEDPLGRQEIQGLRNSLATTQLLLYHYEDLAQGHLMTRQMILRFTRILEAHFSGEEFEGLGPITQDIVERELKGMFLWALQMKVKELK